MLSSILIKKIGVDKSYEGKISETCISSNLLSLAGLKETLTKGIKGLTDEGWVTPKEANEILSQYGGMHDDRGRQDY